MSIGFWHTTGAGSRRGTGASDPRRELKTADVLNGAPVVRAIGVLVWASFRV